MIEELRDSKVLRRTWNLAFSPIHRRVMRLQNIHQDEACYIIGDGVSIKSFDLSQFQNLPSIAVGMIPHHFDFNQLDCRYWVMPEPLFFWPPLTFRGFNSRSARREFQKMYSPKNMIESGLTVFLSSTNFPFFFSKHTQYFFDDLPARNDRRFSVLGSRHFANSVNSALTIALYLGFKRTYLVGFDYTHNPPMSGHWYERGEGIPSALQFYNSEFFTWISQHLEIITVVPREQLTSLKSIDYSSFTHQALSYRENHELTSAQVLKTLSGWLDYRVY